MDQVPDYVLIGLSIADPTIPWPKPGSADLDISDREGWERRFIPAMADGFRIEIEAMVRGELAVNRMIEDEGFAICLADSGWRISYGGRVFARCQDAMRAAEEMMQWHKRWFTLRRQAFTAEQIQVLRDVMEPAERRGEILMHRVFPR